MITRSGAAPFVSSMCDCRCKYVFFEMRSTKTTLGKLWPSSVIVAPSPLSRRSKSTTLRLLVASMVRLPCPGTLTVPRESVAVRASSRMVDGTMLSMAS